MTITMTDPDSYTEAHHTVHGAVSDAAPLYGVHDVGGQPAFVKPRTVTAVHSVRTQLGDDGWALGGIEITGAWVDERGEPHPAFAIAPNTTLLLSAENAPGWALAFAHSHSPTQVRLTLPGCTDPIPPHPTLPAVADQDVAGDNVVSDVRTYGDARHTVHGVHMTGADPLCVPADYPGRSDRWMRPERLAVTFVQRLSALAPIGWAVGDVSVTGPWVSPDGELDADAVGSARWPCHHPYPQWLQNFIARHLPAETSGLAAEPGLGLDDTACPVAAAQGEN